MNSSPHTNPDHPKVSLVIPAYNEAKGIHYTLESVIKQSYQDFELIVVDNNSTDNTAEIAKNYGARVLHEKKKGVSHARQLGFTQAKGSIIVSTDADTVHPVDWIQKIVERFDSDPMLVGLGGTARFRSGPRTVIFASRYLYPPFMKIDKFLSGGWNMSGFCMAVRKDAFEKIGGFDTTLNIGEDVDLSEKLRKVGKVEVDTKLVVFVSGRRYNRGFFQGIWDYAPSTVMRLLFNKRAFNSFKDIRE